MHIPAGSPPSPAPRILLVDSDGASRSRTAHALCSSFAARPLVVEASCGRQASDLLRATDYEAVLLDLLSLADISPLGDVALSRIVRLAAGSLLIVLSDGTSVSSAVAAMRAGAHDVIAKPIGAEELAARIGALAHRHRKARALGLEAGTSETALGELAASSVSPSLRRQQVLPMWRQEQRIIEDAIASFSGSVALAAAALELSPSTIYRKRQAWAEMETSRGAA